jgi:3-oxoacyl-[acyl-carrier protein] reductase
MKPLEGKTALITAGGIGSACALKLAEAGAEVAVTYCRERERAEVLASNLASCKGVFRLDVSDSFSCKEVLDKIGGVDILINSAGILLDKPLLETTNEEIDAVLQTNLYGAFYTARAAARYMMKKRWGRIINIIGFAAYMGVAGETVYSASKGGVLALTKTLAKELGTRNITVNAVSPGLTDTNLLKEMNKVLIDDYLNYAIVKRLGTPEEVADAALYLALPSSEYITGQVIHTNGGLYI